MHVSLGRRCAMPAGSCRSRMSAQLWTMQVHCRVHLVLAGIPVNPQGRAYGDLLFESRCSFQGVTRNSIWQPGQPIRPTTFKTSCLWRVWAQISRTHGGSSVCHSSHGVLADRRSPRH